MVVAEEVKDRLCGAACACASLNYSYFVTLLYLFIVFVSGLQI